MKKNTLLFITLFFLLGTHLAKAQNDASRVIAEAPNVFLDCFDCDYDNFKREVNYVNYLRERQSADIYVLVTSQNTGGGDEYVMYLLGQGRFEGQNDTLTVHTEIDDTEREISNKLLALYKRGLLPYLLQTPLSEQISYKITQKEEKSTEETQSPSDPWKAWVFSISGGGNANGQSTSNSLSLRSRLSANRITEKSKWRFSLSGRQNKQNFYIFYRDSLGEITSTDTFTSVVQSFYANASYIGAIDDHLSWGVFANTYNSSYSNIKLGNDLRLGLEYDLFPYSESDRRMITLTYKIGPTYNQYEDTTIFDQLSEVVWQHQLAFNIYQNQPWGNVSFGIDYSNYLHDFRLNSLSFNPSLNWNVARGLTLTLGGYISLISDQITLPKDQVSIPSLLLRDRIVETDFSYFTYLNLSYTFGSKYSNIVNPRFDGGGGVSYYFF